MAPSDGCYDGERTAPSREVTTRRNPHRIGVCVLLARSHPVIDCLQNDGENNYVISSANDNRMRDANI
jgi:hypothetical protein